MDLREYLNQGKIWITTSGTEVQVSKMSPDHAFQSARWLQQNATGLISVMEATENEDAINGDGHVRNVLALVAQSPRQWMSGMPLYLALMSVFNAATQNARAAYEHMG